MDVECFHISSNVILLLFCVVCFVVLFHCCSVLLLLLCCCCRQSVKVLSYLEPQNPEYRQFVETLKSDAKKLFNFTIEDSLVPTHPEAWFASLALAGGQRPVLWVPHS